MEFISNIELNEYEEFLNESKDIAHFLESPEWGIMSEYKGLKTHYVGVKENGKLIATALLLQKRLPLGYSYFYIPKGFTLDYQNYDLIEFFTKEIDKYTKKFKSLYLKTDPDVFLHKIDSNGTKIDGPDNYKLIEEFKRIGYKHLGFNKYFERSNPRYTFRIDLDRPEEEIIKSFDKTVKQRIKRAETMGVDVYIGEKKDIDKFFNLMVKTEKKKDFYSHNLDFYNYFYDVFSKNNHVTLYIAEINFEKAINKINEEIKSLQESLNDPKISKKDHPNINKQIETYSKTIEEFNELKNNNGDKMVLSSYMIVNYGTKCWTLYSCNEPLVRNAYGNYLIYKEQVIDAHNKGYKIFDAFGTIGDTKTDSSLIGIHDFKKKFGGEYVEFIGEFDYIQNKLLYTLFTKLVPYYRKLVNKSLKKKQK